jgi:hypothetical protein
MDARPRDDSFRLAAPKVQRLSRAMEREAIELLAALLLDAARRRSNVDQQNVVPIRPPLDAPIGTPIGPPVKPGEPVEARNPSKSERYAA